jgi:hypothetical protein
MTVWSVREQVLASLISLVLLLPGALPAQEGQEPAIEDNSFFIEEAYNQEPRVVQHISTFAITGTSRRDLFYSFTQEWPFRSQRDQLSYTVPVGRLDGESTGIGDVLLNYRRQLGAGGKRWAAAPRLSLVLPTGSVSRGLGGGSIGLQLNLPVSYRLTSQVVTHLNAGGTVLPWAKGPRVAGERPTRTLSSVFAGGSLIAPVRLPVQLMFESLVSYDGSIGAGGGVEHTTSWIMSPGIRAALNLGSLQVVPGFALPFTRSDGDTVHDYFLYLSFEHPFAK